MHEIIRQQWQHIDSEPSTYYLCVLDEVKINKRNSFQISPLRDFGLCSLSPLTQHSTETADRENSYTSVMIYDLIIGNNRH